MSTRIIRQEQDVHIFDEADVTRAMNETQRDKIRLIGVCVIVGAVLLATFLQGYLENRRMRYEEEYHYLSAGCSADYSGWDYREVEEILSGKGFRCIKLVKLNDTNFFSRKKKGKVVRVTIDGEEHFRKHDYFKPDAAVVITYH